MRYTCIHTDNRLTVFAELHGGAAPDRERVRGGAISTDFGLFSTDLLVYFRLTFGLCLGLHRDGARASGLPLLQVRVRQGCGGRRARGGQPTAAARLDGAVAGGPARAARGLDQQRHETRPNGADAPAAQGGGSGCAEITVGPRGRRGIFLKSDSPLKPL